MKLFHELIRRRYDERKSVKSNKWSNLIIRVLAVALLVIVIKNFSSEDIKKMKSFFSKQEQTIEIE